MFNGQAFLILFSLIEDNYNELKRFITAQRLLFVVKWQISKLKEPQKSPSGNMSYDDFTFENIIIVIFLSIPLCFWNLVV